MPNEDAVPEGPFFYGNAEEDRTPWLYEWVRLQLAEHHSLIYDTVPKGALPVIVQLVLAGMSAAEGGDDDAEENGTEAPQGS